ncbi:MAG: hypothetical protein KBC15_02415 [Candidatus Levybacteria bacterium]|nr:hypothetical protein [Candidatus Levybacteria bacterium]
MSFFSPVTQKRTLLVTLGVASAYLIMQVFVLNNSLVINTLTHKFPITYKFSVLSQLIIGYFQMFNLGHIILLLVTALLIGLNISLIFLVGKKIAISGKTKLSMGGTGLLSLASVGCPSCSLSVFALFGSGGGFLGLLFSSIWMQGFVVLALLISIYLSLRSYNNKSCDIFPNAQAA